MSVCVCVFVCSVRVCELIRAEKTGGDDVLFKDGGGTAVGGGKGRDAGELGRSRRGRACSVGEIQSPEVNLTEFDRSRRGDAQFLPENNIYYIVFETK